MKTITFNLNCQLEERLRKYTGRKGQLSKILNEAVELWLNRKENTGEAMWPWNAQVNEIDQQNESANAALSYLTVTAEMAIK